MISQDKMLKFYNLTNIVRYNMRYKVKPESVAEHSYFVSLFTMMICEELHLDPQDKLDCLTYALCHDLPEIEISDIPHPVKRSNQVLADTVNEMEFEWVAQNLPKQKDLFVNISVPRTEKDELFHTIVSLADIVSVIQYSTLETNLGNSMFDDIVTSATDRYNIEVTKLENLAKTPIRHIFED